MIALPAGTLIGNPLNWISEKGREFNSAALGRVVAQVPYWTVIPERIKKVLIIQARKDADLAERLFSREAIEGQVLRREYAPLKIGPFTALREYERPVSLNESLERGWLAHTSYAEYGRMTGAPEVAMEQLVELDRVAEPPYYVTPIGPLVQFGLGRPSDGMKRRRTDWKEALAALGIALPKPRPAYAAVRNL